MAQEQDSDDVYLSLSPAILRILNVNGLTIEQVLDRAGVRNLTPVLDPTSKPGQQCCRKDD